MKRCLPSGAQRRGCRSTSVSSARRVPFQHWGRDCRSETLGGPACLLGQDPRAEKSKKKFGRARATPSTAFPRMSGAGGQNQANDARTETRVAWSGRLRQAFGCDSAAGQAVTSGQRLESKRSCQSPPARCHAAAPQWSDGCARPRRAKQQRDPRHLRQSPWNAKIAVRDRAMGFLQA